VTEEEFRERLTQVSHRSARGLRMACLIDALDEVLLAELEELRAEYDALWSWYLARLARRDEDTVE
jgi:hypothetical protein